MGYDVQDFDRDVLQRSHEIPVMVDFWAPWCGPCKMLTPVLENLAAHAAGRWELVKVNTEEHPGLAEAFQISSIPNVKLFRAGSVADEFLGFRDESEIRRWLEPHVPSPATMRLEQAAELIDNGDLAGARLLLEQALAEEPGRAAARLLLAEILLSDNPAGAAEMAGEIPAEANEALHAQALKLLAIAVQYAPESFPEDPSKAELLDGLQAIRRRDWDAALAAMTGVVERRPGYADGLARDTGKAIFRYLGARHPIADKYYRRFSSALNV